MNLPLFIDAKKQFLKSMTESGVFSKTQNGVFSIADKDNKSSTAISTKLFQIIENRYQITCQTRPKVSAQTAGTCLEKSIEEFLRKTFLQLNHLRPGRWEITQISGRSLVVAQYEQYSHLKDLEQLSQDDPHFAAALGNTYNILPDVVIARKPEDDKKINEKSLLVNESISKLTPIRKVNNEMPLLHASISCKFTLRSDRAQNARSEALSFIRNRKGRVPHVVLVTAEPLPSRLASIALGTGDLDCVYHVALYELIEAIESLAKNEVGYEDSLSLIKIMTDGKRLRDLSDLPLDLVI